MKHEEAIKELELKQGYLVAFKLCIQAGYKAAGNYKDKTIQDIQNEYDSLEQSILISDTLQIFDEEQS